MFLMMHIRLTAARRFLEEKKQDAKIRKLRDECIRREQTALYESNQRADRHRRIVAALSHQIP